MMNATSLYMNTCRLVMKVDVKSEDILDELSNLLPYLRQSLVCNACRNILIDPYSSTEKSCQHYVCKMCVVLNKQPKFSCNGGCIDLHNHVYSESTQLQLILKCYKKLCSYIKNTNLYDQLSTIKTSGNHCDLSLTDIIDEALSDESIIPKVANEVNNILGLTEIDSDEPDFYSSDITDNDEDKVVTSTTVSDEGIDIILPPDQSSREDYFTNSEDNIDKSSDLNKFEENTTDITSELIKFDENTDIFEVKEEDTFNFPKCYNSEISHCDSPLLTVDSSDIAPIVEIPILNRPNCSSAFNNLSTTTDYVSLDEMSGPSNHDRPIDNISVHSFNNTDTGTDDNTDQFDKSPTESFDEELNDSQDNSTIEINDNVNNDEIPIPSSSLSSMSKNLSRIYNGINISKTSAFGICVNSNLAVRLSSPNSLKPNMSSLGISSNQQSSVTNINNVKISAPNNTFNHPVSVADSIMPSLDLSTIPNMSNCFFNIQPGSILTSTNVKQVVQETILKQNSVHNNSSVYSVMYNNNDSTGTKITIKRKPPELENVNKITIEPEKNIPNCQGIPKKVKPKPKPKPKRKGCRCGNATPTPGKLTCCGQRCPCYVEAKACLECQCRGCRNPHRPGGKKVRPVIPQLGNIQIHQVQPVHQKTIINQSLCNNVSSLHSIPNTTSIITTSGGVPIRTVHAMHAIHGMGQVHNMPSGMHQLINIGGTRPVMDTSSLTGGMQSEMTLKPFNIAYQSIPVPTQILLNDEKSISTSENSDVDIDI